MNLTCPSDVDVELLGLSVCQVLWTTSIWLESVAIVPQLVLLQQMREADSWSPQAVSAAAQVQILFVGTVLCFPESDSKVTRVFSKIGTWIRGWWMDTVVDEIPQSINGKSYRPLECFWHLRWLAGFLPSSKHDPPMDVPSLNPTQPLCIHIAGRELDVSVRGNHGSVT